MLPDNLPPTFRGKSLKFSYELVIGTCRSSNSGAGSAAGANSISRVMKVPIRLYNNIVGEFLILTTWMFRLITRLQLDDLPKITISSGL